MRTDMKKLTAFLLIFLAALLIVSCGGNTPGGDDTATDSTEAEKVFYIVDDTYRYVRADKMSDAPLSAAVELRKAIRDICGVDLSFESDWSMDNRDNNTVESTSDVHEILIGDTNRAESRAIAEEFKDMARGYIIRAVNGKIVIWGSDSETLTFAIEYFRNDLIVNNAIKLEEGFSYLWDMNAEGSPFDIIKKEYSLVYASGDSDKVWTSATKLSESLSEFFGNKVELGKDTAAASAKEILVGLTDREESQTVFKELNYMDYTIRAVGGKIVVLGGSPLATQNAADKLVSVLTSDSLTLEDGILFDYDFDALLTDSIINNIEAFVPNWASEFTPPEWMLDYEEKLRTLTTSKGRISSDAHRGDTQNYPENSLEGVLSALLMGADVVEVDVRLTKDNVMVLMHDASLKRTTDWSKKAGSKGLPSSDQISDWTYEQLSQLRLLYNGEATDYRIPTMYEIAVVCAKRGQIHFDCKDDRIEKATDIYLLAEATGSKESFIYYYGLDTMRIWMNNNPEDKEFTEFYNKMRKLLSGSSLRRRNTSVYDNYADAPDGWKACFAAGYPKMLTNYIYDFCRFSAAEQEPTK